MQVIPRNIKQIQKLLRQGELTMQGLVRYYLGRIKEYTRLNAFVEVYEQEVLDVAHAIDQRISHGKGMLPLTGLVISVKDVIAYANHGLTAGSRILDGYKSPFTATALQRLLDAGAIVIGRTNCDEFGMGSENKNSVYGPTLNGIGEGRIPGGSSGGAAVSVQMDMCLMALGSDTGGSVRQPAAFCGVYGYKPSYGFVSRYGLVAYGSSFDQIGVIGHEVVDMEKVLAIMGGADVHDATSSSEPLAYKSSSPAKSIAVLRPFVDHPALSPEIKRAIEKKISDLQGRGYKVDYVDFGFMDVLVPAYYVLTTAEASANLSRYDGVRYGYRSDKGDSLEDMYVHTRTEGFGLEVKKRILLGTYVLSEGYYEAYFGQAQKVRRLICEKMEHIFDDYDLVMLPVSTDVAWKTSESKSEIEVYLSDVCTVLANLCGLPAISIPAGFSKEGLPIGLQYMAGKNADFKLLEFCANEEKDLP